jgi:hypothetical protein
VVRSIYVPAPRQQLANGRTQFPALFRRRFHGPVRGPTWLSIGCGDDYRTCFAIDDGGGLEEIGMREEKKDREDNGKSVSDRPGASRLPSCSGRGNGRSGVVAHAVRRWREPSTGFDARSRSAR